MRWIEWLSLAHNTKTRGKPLKELNVMGLERMRIIVASFRIWEMNGLPQIDGYAHASTSVARPSLRNPTAEHWPKAA